MTNGLCKFWHYAKNSVNNKKIKNDQTKQQRSNHEKDSIDISKLAYMFDYGDSLYCWWE